MGPLAALLPLAGPRREVFTMVLSADVSDLLDRVTCPTLIIDTTIDTDNVIRAQSADVAAQIAGARLIKLGIGDHFPIRPADTRAVLADICEFVTGERPKSPTRRALATICFTDIVGSTDGRVRSATATGSRPWPITINSWHRSWRVIAVGS